MEKADTPFIIHEEMPTEAKHNFEEIIQEAKGPLPNRELFSENDGSDNTNISV
jgi:hypothetical protein